MYIVDAHTHIGYWNCLWKTQYCLLKSMKQHHINKAIFSMDASEFENEDPKFKNNRSVKLSSLEIGKIALKFCRRHKNLSMLLWIKPNTEEITAELKDFILSNSKFIKGLKIHPCLSKIKMTDKKLIPYIEFAKENNLPILVHTADDEYSKIEYLEKVAKKYKDVTFIAAHMELCSDNNKAIEVVKNNSNIYADTAWVNIKIVEKLKKLNLVHKIMFGTDAPIDGFKTYPNPMYQDYFKNVIDLNAIDYGMLMHVNAERIYKL